MSYFSLNRLWAMVLKEFIQMRRDRVTFAMMIGIPLLQLTLFGFAINSDPRHLPTAVLIADHGTFARTLAAELRTSTYFEIIEDANSELNAHKLLQKGDVQFVISIPIDFTRKLLRGEKPQILVEADATDPAATGPALSTFQYIASRAFNRDLKGSLAHLKQNLGPLSLNIHLLYNPENITQYNIVPGLMGVILTMTMVIITALAITRERERGTMENLLATPVRPVEVMLGKIIPFILVGYIQVTLILLAAHFLFHVPMVGNIFLIYCVAIIFIAANLAMGITFSSIAKNQLQAVQMAFFFFLPSILITGFMFPFRGMPLWAQYVGTCLPNTHFLRIVRGVLLKGNGLNEILPELWPIVLFATVAMTVGIKRYRQTLD
jgi:ABC-2 type transport system permease protein